MQLSFKALAITIFALIIQSQNAFADCYNHGNAQQCMICNCAYEASDQSHEGKVLVVRSVLGRMKTPGFPGTACGVIYQRRQYSWTLSAAKKAASINSFDTAQCLKAIKDANAAGPGPQFYHAKYVSPTWAQQKKKATTEGAHVFYWQPGHKFSLFNEETNKTINATKKSMERKK
jgi:spore germination cell wall hydrolase CwlJ-like protein